MLEEDRKVLLNSYASNIPLGRTGHAYEVANAVAFLASNESSFINGIELPIDGGMTQI